ncbi:MAG: hypothetical protein ACE145_21935 [Terriglobia bacterium]
MIFLVVGVGCTFYPHSLQEILAGRKNHPLSIFAPKSKLIKAYVESPWYIVHVRFGGLIALAGAGVGLYGLVKFVARRIFG